MDVLVLAVLFSWAYRWLKHTIAVQIALGLLTLLVASWTASQISVDSTMQMAAAK